MSSFIIKYDSVGGVRDFVLKKVQASETLKELKVSIADDFLVLLSWVTSYAVDQLKIHIMHRKIKGTSII